MTNVIIILSLLLLTGQLDDGGQHGFLLLVSFKVTPFMNGEKVQ